MGYTDLDKLAINTIRVLAVSPVPETVPRPRCALSAAMGSTARAAPLRVALSWAPERLLSWQLTRSDLSLGRCHLQCQLGPSGCPDVRAPDLANLCLSGE